MIYISGVDNFFWWGKMGQSWYVIDEHHIITICNAFKEYFLTQEIGTKIAKIEQSNSKTP